MNEAKHTPGPWFVNESEDKYDQARNWRQIVTVKNKPEILIGTNAITKEDAHLNCRCP